MPSTNAKGQMKVGNYLEWSTGGVRNEREQPSGRHTLVKIVSVEGLNMDNLMKSLTPNQNIIAGSNLLDDPRMEGHADPTKVYVFEQ